LTINLRTELSVAPRFSRESKEPLDSEALEIWGRVADNLVLRGDNRLFFFPLRFAEKEFDLLEQGGEEIFLL